MNTDLVVIPIYLAGIHASTPRTLLIAYREHVRQIERSLQVKLQERARRSAK